MKFLEINRICPLTMLLKCTKFVKYTCDSFLKIFLTMLKWADIHTHTRTAAMLYPIHNKLREGIIKRSILSPIQPYDDLSPTVRKCVLEFLYTFHA